MDPNNSACGLTLRCLCLMYIIIYESALLKVTSDALMAADQGKVTLLGLLDLSSAFDCVDHGIFLRRIKLSFGVTDRALAWSASYLGDRSQRVHYNGVDSRTVTISCGVPQGSVLGPAYFLLYSANVFEIARRYGFLIHGYADDLQLYQHCASSDMGLLNIRLSTACKRFKNGCLGTDSGSMRRRQK